MANKLSVEISGKLTSLEQAIAKSNALLEGFDKKVSSLSNNSQKNFSGIGSAAKAAGGVLAASLSLGSLASFAKSVIQVTGEFQKFEAVLSNTLGSGSAAQKAMTMLQDFAAKTPFSVQELTSSFVKLANQGFKPNVDQLRSLGDLASSTGKSFDQLAEAIIDAQTGEFERLKEFGVRAEKQGDNVTFTFKGVQKQVDFTSRSIREYILSLGNAEGVSGSMAKISETLVGKISNLGDAYDQLLKTIGDSTSGPIGGAVTGLSKLLEATTQYLKIQSLMQGGSDDSFFNKVDFGESASQLKIGREYLDLLKQIKSTNTGTEIRKIWREMELLASENGKAAQSAKELVDRDTFFAYQQMYRMLADEAVKASKDITNANKQITPPVKPDLKKVGKFSANANPDAPVDLSSLTKAAPVSDFKAQTNLLNNAKQIAIETAGEVSKVTQAYGMLGAQIEQVGIKSITITSQISLTSKQLAAQAYLIENIGGIISSSFDQLLTDGNDVFKSLINGLKALIAKLIAAAVAAAALAVFLTASGINKGASFGKLFGQLSGLSGIIGGGGAASGRLNTNSPSVEPAAMMAGGGGSVEFEIRGDRLFGVLKNYGETISRIS